MIKNIIFDIGKVLVSYEPDIMMKDLGFDDDIIGRVNKALFENELWEQSDQGLFSPSEILQKAIDNDTDIKDYIVKAWENVGKSIARYDYVYDWINTYKDNGYNVYILSNYSKHTLEHTKEQLSFLSLMDGVVFSYECKLMKPMEEIYNLLLEKYDFVPEECIFIDDRPVNIEGAKKCGINGIVFKDYNQAKRDIAAICNKYK